MIGVDAMHQSLEPKVQEHHLVLGKIRPSPWTAFPPKDGRPLTPRDGQIHAKDQAAHEFEGAADLGEPRDEAAESLYFLVVGRKRGKTLHLTKVVNGPRQKRQSEGKKALQKEPRWP